jgi:hypothetical protein
VDVRFTAAGTPLAVRHEGRLWAVAADPVRSELQIEALFGGGNTRVPDHSPGRPRILLEPGNLPL